MMVKQKPSEAVTMRRDTAKTRVKEGTEMRRGKVVMTTIVVTTETTGSVEMEKMIGNDVAMTTMTLGVVIEMTARGATIEKNNTENIAVM